MSTTYGEEASPAPFQPEFFAFQTGFTNAQSREPAYLAEMVHKAGFDGVELMGLERVDAFIPELESRGLKLYTLYIKIDLDSDQPYDPKLKHTLLKWKDKIPYIWLHIHSRRHGRSNPAGDERCVEILRELADFAGPLGVSIGIYHHTGQWSEKFSDGVRVARKVQRYNVGAVFNLCHYLKVTGPANLEQELRDAFPQVMLVSINGADDGATTTMKWDRLIRPLGEGSFDVRRVLLILKEKNYRGPIGLQGFGVREKPEEFFPASVTAFKKYLEETGR